MNNWAKGEKNLDEEDSYQTRGQRFGALCNEFGRVIGFPRKILYNTDGTGWIWLNRGFLQYTIRYDFNTGALVVWRGYFFVKISKKERIDNLKSPEDTVNWILERES